MSDRNLCPECGAEIPAGAPAGQCPKCMMKAGFESEVPGSSGFEPPSVDALSERFPQLEILELVGKGGMGAVYKARQPGLDRFVALKVLPLEVGRDPAFAERFTREARAMARLSHPNIVAIHDFGQTDGLFYFVMDYIDGANLRHTLQAGKLRPEEALAIVPQICDALQFAHDEGIVHRDIKPENVLIDIRGRVKIADFGLAKLLGQEQTEGALTQTNQVMGTLRYMAPEQMRGSHDVDHRADIYSLGVVFYELLTGEVPMGRFDPPSRQVQIDVRLDEVVLRALAQEPDKRYQQVSEVKTDVESLTSKPAPAVARKPDLDQAQAVEVKMESARQEVKVPAIGLMVAGVLTCLMAALPMLLGVKTIASWDMRGTDDGPSPVAAAPASEAVAPEASARPAPLNAERSEQTASGASPTLLPQSEEGPTWRVMSVAGVVLAVAGMLLVVLFPALGIIIVWGGWNLLHLRSHGLAMTASILALFPCQPAFFVGLVFGIWSLIVLNRPHVRVAFKSKHVPRTNMTKEPEAKPAQDYVGLGVALGAAFGVAFGTALDNLGVGIGIGVGLGLAIGTALSVANPKDAG